MTSELLFHLCLHPGPFPPHIMHTFSEHAQIASTPSASSHVDHYLQPPCALQQLHVSKNTQFSGSPHQTHWLHSTSARLKSTLCGPMLHWTPHLTSFQDSTEVPADLWVQVSIHANPIRPPPPRS
jgi:hypothetical protein